MIRSDYQLLIYALIDIKIRNPYFRKIAISEKKNDILNEVISEAKAAIKGVDMSKFPMMTELGIDHAFKTLTDRVMSDENYDSLTHLSSFIIVYW